MNNEDILRMAKEAGWQVAGIEPFRLLVTTDGDEIETLTKFAALVQAATAEECAKVCDAEFERTKPEARGSSYYEGRNDGADALGEAIRTKYQDQTTSGEKV